MMHMTRVIISMQDTVLSRAFKRLPVSRCRHLDLGDQPSRLASQLAQAGAGPVAPTLQGQEFADHFTRAYVDFIGRIGIRHNTLDWWVTFAASKNRITSRLSHNLLRLLRVEESLARLAPEHILLILNPPEEVCVTLKRSLRARGIRVRTLGRGMGWCADHAKAVLVPVLAAVVAAWRISRRKWWLRRPAAELMRRLQAVQPAYVVKTFLYDHSLNAAGRYEDTFFGRLPQYLQGRRPTMVLADLVGTYPEQVRRILQCQEMLIVPLEHFCSVGDVWWAIVRAMSRRTVLNERLAFEGWDVGSLVNAEIARSSLSPTLIIDYLHFACVRRLAGAVPLETFFFTCENNPWERMCILALRRFAPKASIVGYQHSVVTRASANMFVSAGEAATAPLPDWIVTVGEAPKRIIDRYGALGAGRVRPGCALRSASLFRLTPQPRRPIRRILVALDGLKEICHVVNYAARELREHSEFEVTFRTHPLVPLERIRRRLRYDLARVGHFRRSGASLSQDLERTDLVLYWGSTVGAEALMLGTPVIHFDRGDVLSYDPLFECRALKWVVHPDDRLIDTIRGIEALDGEEFERRRREARAYVQTYFHEVTEDRLGVFLRADAPAESPRPRQGADQAALACERAAAGEADGRP